MFVPVTRDFYNQFVNGPIVGYETDRKYYTPENTYEEEYAPPSNEVME